MSNSTTLYALGDGRVAVDVTENKTLALADTGIVQNVKADAIAVTLPATAAALNFIVRNGGAHPTGTPAGAVADGTVLVKVSPNASDKIQGLAFSAADNKAAQNTKATSKVGDEISLLADAGDGWTVRSAKGTWAREG